MTTSFSLHLKKSLQKCLKACSIREVLRCAPIFGLSIFSRVAIPTTIRWSSSQSTQQGCNTENNFQKFMFSTSLFSLSFMLMCFATFIFLFKIQTQRINKKLVWFCHPPSFQLFAVFRSSYSLRCCIIGLRAWSCRLLSEQRRQV